jgi:hypothetical protein
MCLLVGLADVFNHLRWKHLVATDLVHSTECQPQHIVPKNNKTSTTLGLTDFNMKKICMHQVKLREIIGIPTSVSELTYS